MQGRGRLHAATVGSEDGTRGAVGRDSDFTEFVAARRNKLYRTAVLLCGDPHQAEDIVQQALTKLYGAWSRVARLDNVDAYVRRIVVNAHLDEVRRPWQRERPDPLIELPTGPCPSASLEDADALWRALARLAPRQRQVVVLRHYWGLSVTETAEDLGISTGAVKSTTSDALERLRDELGDLFVASGRS